MHVNRQIKMCLLLTHSCSCSDVITLNKQDLNFILLLH